jgi:2-methylisocitrate lyase-like PEP mutase family enzyme
MEKKVKFRDLISKEQVFAPCVFDCISARAAYLCGYKAAMLSGGAVAYSMDGLPDMALQLLMNLWLTANY